MNNDDAEAHMFEDDQGHKGIQLSSISGLNMLLLSGIYVLGLLHRI